MTAAFHRYHASRYVNLAQFLIVIIFALMPAAVVTARSMTMQSSQTESSHPFGERTESIDDRHVYDFANVLSDPEIVTISSDADRLQRHGMPAVIVTTVSDMAPDEAARVAAAVRQDWDIGTAPGEDDGLLFLVVVPESPGGSAYAILSWGAQALPLEGLTGPASESIYQQWIRPWLAEPQVFEAVTYGVRRMIYHIIYEPAPQAPLTGARDVAHNVADWFGILLVIASAAGWIALRAGFRIPRPISPSSALMVELVPFLVIAALAGLSVFGQSRIGVASAGVLLLGFLITWIRRDTTTSCGTGTNHTGGPSDSGGPGARPGRSTVRRRSGRAPGRSLPDTSFAEDASQYAIHARRTRVQAPHANPGWRVTP